MKTVPTVTDLPAQALLLSALRRAARIPLCPLCAQQREEITTPEGQAGFSCPRCGDFAPHTAPKGTNR